MTGLDLITVGESFEDLIFYDLPRIPGAGEEVKTDRLARTVGGGAVITAVTAARLGLRSAVVSGLGPSAVALLTRERVAFRNMIRNNEQHALSISLSTGTDRSFVTFNGVNAVLEERLSDATHEWEARHIHFAFYPKDCARWVDVVHHMGTRRMTTSWDFGWNEGLRENAHFLGLLAALDFVFVNQDEVRLYSGSPTLEAAVEFMKAHTRNTIVKLGSEGCRWVSPECDLSSPAIPTKVVDTTGAGDAFNGGFFYALSSGESPERALLTANHVASLSIRAPGGIDGLPQRSEIA